MSNESIEMKAADTGDAQMKGAQEENFAAMLDKSSMGQRLFPGQKIRTKVISISGDLVYVDLGGKSEGVVTLSEFLDKNGVAGVRAGDEIDAFYVTFEDGLMRLTTLVRGYSAATLNSIRDACDAGLPVNGEVKREIKGGFEVAVGGVRCFCPFSQIDLKGGREGGVYLGRTFPFKVLEYGEEGKKIVVSRRAVLEEEKQAKIKELRERLFVGMELDAEVKAIQKFGAFVDLGGVEGLIPASELSWDRSVSPSDLLSVGQRVTAKIIAIDWERNRLSLSIKALQPDPWALVSGKYSVDSRVSGSIVRLTSFGAFVRLEPGVEGLLHISNLGAGRRINHPREVVEEGQSVEVYVLSIDAGNRKISLSMQPKVEPERVVLPSVGDVLNGTVEKVMPYGIFLKLSSALTGLIPNAEMGTPSGSDHRGMFPPGTELRVAVIEVDTASNKVRLSRKSVLEKASQDEFDQYKDSVKTSEGTVWSLGTLGDILRARLEEKKNSS
jgi:small subunit ribosomal protein S1